MTEAPLRGTGGRACRPEMTVLIDIVAPRCMSRSLALTLLPCGEPSTRARTRGGRIRAPAGGPVRRLDPDGDALRGVVRGRVLGLIGDMNASRFTIFRSLTVLRQLSLHAGLIDEAHASLASAKIDALLDQLHEVTGGGHRALVFSQFAGFLGMVRERLEAEGIPYCYDAEGQEGPAVLQRPGRRQRLRHRPRRRGYPRPALLTARGGCLVR